MVGTCPKIIFDLISPRDRHEIDKLEVRWPSGATDIRSDVMAAQFDGVLQGKGLSVDSAGAVSALISVERLKYRHS